jgi:hypothetical protein
MSHPLLDYLPETEALEPGILEAAPADRHGALDEGTEIELASELLEATGDAERVDFLNNLVARTANVADRALSTPQRARLLELLARHAQRVLPLGPSPTKQAGIRLAADAGHVLGLELEGLSPEDQEFEVARSFVRFASDAVRSAARPAAGPAPETGRWIRRGPTLVLLDC